MRFFNILFVAKHEKIEENKKFSFSGKNLTMPKKTERGDLWDFSTSILSQNIKKLKGGPFGEKKNRKKVSQCRKKLKKGRPLKFRYPITCKNLEQTASKIPRINNFWHDKTKQYFPLFQKSFETFYFQVRLTFFQRINFPFNSLYFFEIFFLDCVCNHF